MSITASPDWERLSDTLEIDSPTALRDTVGELTARLRGYLAAETDAGDDADFATAELARVADCDELAARELLHLMSVSVPGRLERVGADTWRFHAPEES